MEKTNKPIPRKEASLKAAKIALAKGKPVQWATKYATQLKGGGDRISKAEIQYQAYKHLGQYLHEVNRYGERIEIR